MTKVDADIGGHSVVRYACTLQSTTTTCGHGIGKTAPVDIAADRWLYLRANVGGAVEETDRIGSAADLTLGARAAHITGGVGRCRSQVGHDVSSHERVAAEALRRVLEAIELVSSTLGAECFAFIDCHVGSGCATATQSTG